MKKINLLLFLLISLFVTTKVEAITYTDEDIEDYSIVIGSHLFTTEPEETTGYDGFLTTKFAMLGASSITGSSSTSDMIIYYKWGLEDWEEYITGEVVEFPESVNITHINGVCVDPSCDGTVIEVTLKYNDATAYNDETAETSSMNKYQSKFTEPVTPTKLGFDFVCWELDGECYDFDSVLEENITLEATWSPRTYNVTYHDTVGGGTETITCNFASATPCAYIPYDSDLLFELPAGYTFVGWSIAESGEKVYNNNDIIEIYGENTNIDLYSIFSSGTYGVSYNLAGGTFGAAVSPVTEYDPSNLTYNLYTPSRIGYTFNGWSVDASSTGSAKVNSNGTFTVTSLGNIVLKANWTANKYNVIYNNNGSNVQLNTKTCVYDSNCSLDFSKITVASGKELKEVTVTVDGNTYVIGTTVKNLTTANEDVTAKVTFADIIYNISYDYVGGSVSTANTTEIKLGDILTLNTPTKKGYIFGGWTVSSGLTLSGNKITLKTAGNATVTAKWTAIQYSVYYKNGNSEVLLSTSGCTYDQFCTLDTSKVKPSAGYEFAYLQGTVDGETAVIGDKVINLTDVDGAKVYLTPIFTMIDYSITYDLDGGKFLTDNTSVINITQTVGVASPVKEGYTFNGWTVISGTATVNGANVTLTAANNITLKASWKVNEYNVSFDLNGGSGTFNTMSCTYTDCTLPSTIPTKTGYDFDGWMYNGALYEAGEKITIDSTSTISLVAKWINTSEYTINYNLNGGTFEGAPLTTFISTDTFNLSTPVREGYTFGGWFDGTTEVKSVSGRTEDISVTAKWNAISYKINLYADSNGSTLLKDIDCTYDTDCSIGDNSSSFSDKRLLGWSKNANGNLFYGDNLTFKNLVTEANGSINLYPVLEEITYDYVVGYYLDGGTYVDSSNLVTQANNNDVITLPEVEKFGYEVDYWLTDTNEKITDTTYTVTSNVVLVPVWKDRTSYTVNLVHGYDDSVDPVVVECKVGVPCDLPANTFTREGCTFDSWQHTLPDGENVFWADQDSLQLNIEFLRDTMQSFELEFVASWQPKLYNVTYIHDSTIDDTNTEIYLPSAYYYGDSVLEISYLDVNSSSSQFVAWSYNGEIIPTCEYSTELACLDISNLSEDIEIVAHYADELVTVAYNADYTYSDRGQEQTASNNGSLSILPGMKITGLPESVSYQRGPNTTTVNIVGWTLDDVEIDLDEYVVTTDIELVAIFE